MLKDIILRESVQHLEELPVKQFISAVESLKEKIVTEKLDGANLWFGIDDVGVFSSREGKSSKSSRFYKLEDWPMVANYNAFRAAHSAILQAEPIIRQHLQTGDAVEAEILYGRQPNTVTYGVADKNFIVILRGVNGTSSERVKKLEEAINGKSYDVSSIIVSSPDGEKLEQNTVDMTWQFTNVAPLQDSQIDTSGAVDLLADLKTYLNEPNEKYSDKTNLEVSELNLTSVPKSEREEAKAERDRVIDYIQNTYKVPIKEKLLDNIVRKVKPMLQADKLHPSEDIGIEGVVVRDPVTGSMTKIVDKDVFTAINTFNNAVRSTAAGLTRTLNPDAPIELRGGAYGDAKIKIAELLGAKELALSSGTRRFLSKFKKHDEESTAQAVAESLALKSPQALRTRIISVLNTATNEIDDILSRFKQDAKSYKLKLKTGKEIGISPEVMKRTLTAFAETKKDISEIIARVKTSSTGAQLILALYGKTIKSLFEGSNINESFSLLKTIMKEDEVGGDASVITSGNVASNPDTLLSTKPTIINGKLIHKRIRKFKKPKKFTNVKEDFNSFNDLKFATDVDDTVQGQNDVKFNQLRNNINIGDNVTTMDVNRYLDKAHEINDSIDSIAYGVETDDGKITKVYVNASQADEFEKAMADSLGGDDDIEDVINRLADTFDIVDVEWPVGNNGEEESPVEVSTDTEDAIDDIDFTLHDEDGNPIDELSDEDNIEDTQTDSNDDSNDNEEESSDDSDDSDKSEEESSEKPEEDEQDEEDEEDSDEERDEFGQIIKKKTNESVKASYKFKDILVENRKGWIFGALPDIGLQISSERLDIRIIDEDEMDKLQKAISNRKETTVLSSTGRRFKFEPVDNGRYYVYELGVRSIGDYLEVEDIKNLDKFLSGE